MNEIAVVDKGADWRRLKVLAWTASLPQSPNGRNNLGLDEFVQWYGQKPRPGFTKATVAA